MNTTAIRLATVTVFLALISPYVLRALVTGRPHVARPPAEDIHKLPMQIGNSRGEESELDPELFNRIGAKAVVERKYRDDVGREIFLHMAIFDDPEVGVYHAPTNCYRSAGWHLMSEELASVPIPGKPDLVVKLTKWERKGETIWVVFWYRFGDYTVYERLALGKARLAMRGQAVWPSMIKVLLQTDTVDGFAARPRILDMARRVHEWISTWDVAKALETAPKQVHEAPKTHS